MVEYIHSHDTLVAIFVPGSASPEKTRFITEKEEPLQWGIGVFKKGSMVEPHCHASSPATIKEFQEFILIRKGKAQAEVYAPSGALLRTITMEQGDALLLLRGGHAFYFDEDTELLEVKQGPYLGREEMKHALPVPGGTRPGTEVTESVPSLN